MTAEEIEENKSQDSFLIYDLIKKVRESENGVINGFKQFPKDVIEVDIFKQYTDNPNDYNIVNWRQWGVYDEADNEGRFGDGPKGVLMPTIRIDKDGYSVFLGVTGGIMGKELHYHVEKTK